MCVCIWSSGWSLPSHPSTLSHIPYLSQRGSTQVPYLHKWLDCLETAAPGGIIVGMAWDRELWDGAPIILLSRTSETMTEWRVPQLDITFLSYLYFQCCFKYLIIRNLLIKIHQEAILNQEDKAPFNSISFNSIIIKPFLQCIS